MTTVRRSPTAGRSISRSIVLPRAATRNGIRRVWPAQDGIQVGEICGRSHCCWIAAQGDRFLGRKPPIRLRFSEALRFGTQLYEGEPAQRLFMTGRDRHAELMVHVACKTGDVDIRVDVTYDCRP